MKTPISTTRKRGRASQKALELHYSIDQVALVLGVHKNSVRNWLNDGTLGRYVQVGTVIRVPASVVNQFLEEHTV